MIRRELPKLEKQLYARQESDVIKQRAEEISRLGARENQIAEEYQNAQTAPRVYRDIQKERARKWRKVLLIAGLGVGVAGLLAAAIGGFVWYRLRVSVNAEQLQVEVLAAEAITSGDLVTYTVKYGNDSYVDWLDVELVIEVPLGFQVTSVPEGAELSGRTYVVAIGQLNKGESGEVELSGRLVGELSSSAKAQATLYASPENYQKVQFEKSAIVSTTFIAVPLDLALEAPSRIVPGEQMLVKISVTNTSEDAIDNSYLKLSIPAGMQAVTEDPQFTDDFSVVDSRWMLPALEPYETVTRQAVMLVEGQSGDKRILEVSLGILNDENSFVQQTQSVIAVLTSPELQIEQQYNGSSDSIVAAAGETVSGVITYRNVGQIALQDVVVTAQIEGDAFDPETLKLTSGAYDIETKKITWTAASVSQLAVLQPQAEGQLEYSFKIKEIDNFATDESSENNVVVVTANVDSPTITNTGQEASGSDRKLISIRSDMTLDITAFYDDGRLGLVSSGPLPPEVGQETTYTVRVRVGSVLNTLGDVRATIILADGVKYTGQSVKTAGEISFNDRTGEMVWNIAQVGAGAGRIDPAEELYIQVAVVPAEYQRGNTIQLVNKVEASGQDIFTESNLSAQLDKLPTTATASSQQGVVQ